MSASLNQGSTENPSLDEQRQQLRRMKLIAFALLAAAGVLFVVARIFEDGRAWVGYVRAFAEAAMVGGLADWFAITALFRHPLRLPIPHTAIIPKRKAEIGRGLGEFVRSNFLVPDVLEERVRTLQPAARIAAWAVKPESADRVTDVIARAVKAGGAALNDEQVQDLLEGQLRLQVGKVQVAPLLGRTLSVALADGRQEQLVDGVLDRIQILLDKQLPSLRIQFDQESPWWVPEGIDNKVFARIVSGVQSLLRDVRHDRSHPVRRSMEEGIQRTLTEMSSDPKMIARGEEWKAELLDHPEVRVWLGAAWRDVRASLEADLSDRSSLLRQQLADSVHRAGTKLSTDMALAKRIDDGVVRGVLNIAASSGDEVASLITTTVEKWNTEETVDRIETQIGRDLQFVRMNGTIVGGLIGVVLHGLSQLF
jgi:uncharacterized membrane-anchored protein YjiN (DUF445 family)